MASHAAVAGVVGFIFVVGFLVYKAGKDAQIASVPAVFQPHFGKGADEDYKCFVLVDRRGARVVCAGCYGRVALAEMQAAYKAVGEPLPFKVVAEFNRELDI